MAKDITIHFKDNKPHRVTGARSPGDKSAALRFGEAFVEGLKAPATTPLVTPEERRLMRHGLGLDRSKVAYRNRYTAAPGTPAFEAMTSLAARGLAESGRVDSLAWFSLTEAGIAAVTEPGEREVLRWVYRSKRGALGIVHAAFRSEAWRKANTRHAAEVLWTDEGEAWVGTPALELVREKARDLGERAMTEMRCAVTSAQGEQAMTREEQYDAEVAPLLLQAAQRCEKLGMSMIANVEYDPGKHGRTDCEAPGADLAQRVVHWAARAGNNVDSLILAIMRHANEHGHSSICLKTLGVPTTPGEKASGR